MQVDSAWWKSRGQRWQQNELLCCCHHSHLTQKNSVKIIRKTLRNSETSQKWPKTLNFHIHLSTHHFSFTISTYCWQAQSLPPGQGASACQRKGRVFQKDLGDFGSTDHAPIWVHWLNFTNIHPTLHQVVRGDLLDHQ